MQKFLELINAFTTVRANYIKAGKFIESREMNSRDLLPTMTISSYKIIPCSGWDEHEWKGKITLFHNIEMHFCLYLVEIYDEKVRNFIMRVSSDISSVNMENQLIKRI